MAVTEASFSERLRKLQSEMWIHYPPTRGSYGYSKEKGKLTKRQVMNILNTARKFNMPIVICGLGWFADIGVSIYENEMAPTLRGVVKREHLFTLSENHLNPKDFPWTKNASGGNVHAEAWELFTEYTHSENNVQRIKDSGFKEQPTQKGAFDY